jgi:hypothetical protein
VAIVAGLAHDGDDLINGWRVDGVALAQCQSWCRAR